MTCHIPSLPLAKGVYRLLIGCGDGRVQLDTYNSDVHLQVSCEESVRPSPTSPDSRAFCHAEWGSA